MEGCRRLDSSIEVVSCGWSSKMQQHAWDRSIRQGRWLEVNRTFSLEKVCVCRNIWDWVFCSSSRKCSGHGNACLGTTLLNNNLIFCPHSLSYSRYNWITVDSLLEAFFLDGITFFRWSTFADCLKSFALVCRGILRLARQEKHAITFRKVCLLPGWCALVWASVLNSSLCQTMSLSIPGSDAGVRTHILLRLSQNVKNEDNASKINLLSSSDAESLVPGLVLPADGRALHIPQAINIHPQHYLQVRNIQKVLKVVLWKSICCRNSMAVMRIPVKFRFCYWRWSQQLAFEHGRLYGWHARSLSDKLWGRVVLAQKQFSAGRKSTLLVILQVLVDIAYEGFVFYHIRRHSKYVSSKLTVPMWADFCCIWFSSRCSQILGRCLWGSYSLPWSPGNSSSGTGNQATAFTLPRRCCKASGAPWVQVILNRCTVMSWWRCYSSAMELLINSLLMNFRGIQQTIPIIFQKYKIAPLLSEITKVPSISKMCTIWVTLAWPRVIPEWQKAGQTDRFSV